MDSEMMYMPVQLLLTSTQKNTVERIKKEPKVFFSDRLNQGTGRRIEITTFNVVPYCEQPNHHTVKQVCHPSVHKSALNVETKGSLNELLESLKSQVHVTGALEQLTHRRIERHLFGPNNLCSLFVRHPFEILEALFG